MKRSWFSRHPLCFMALYLILYLSAFTHLVVTSRNAGDAPELCAKARQLDPAGQRILFAPVTALPMASSALRQRLAAGEDCAEELPEAVRAVIRREHLYQT